MAPTHTTPELARALVGEVGALRDDLRSRFRLLIAMGAVGALLVSVCIGSATLAYRSAANNGELLRIARPLTSPEAIAASRRRAACLPLIASGQRPAPCDDVVAELVDAGLLPAGR